MAASDAAGTDKLTPKFELLIDGAAADAAVVESIITIRVHQHLELADAIELRLSNDDFAWTDGETFREGTSLSVKLGYEEGGGKLVEVASGEVVRLDCEFPVRGPAVVTVVAYDKEHRLKRGVHNRTFVDMKDSEIAGKIAGEVGLSADVEDSGVKHRYVFQSMQTNLSFLRERAFLCGFVLDIDRANRRLSFKKPAEGQAVATLTWGANLLSFAPRMTTDEQVSKVTVRGWDMAQKKMIEGSATAKDARLRFDAQDKGAALAERAYGAREVLYSDRPFHEVAEGTAMAVARLNEHALRYVEGRASCQGEPKIEAGSVVRIEKTSARTDGDYYVVKVLHHFEPGVGYSTHFEIARSAERLAPAEREELPEPVPARSAEPTERPHWVAFEVVSETGESLEGTSWKVTLPGGKIEQGTLGPDQTIRLEGVRNPGDCKIELGVPDDLQPLPTESEDAD